MERRPEASWLVGLQEREGPSCLVASRLDRHLEPAQIDWSPLARTKNDDIANRVTHDDFSSSRARFFGLVSCRNQRNARRQPLNCRTRPHGASLPWVT